MAAVGVIPNVALGRTMELIRRVDGNDPTDAVIVIVLCSAGDTVGNLRDFDSLQAILAGDATESAFTNYSRVVLDDGDISAPTVDDTDDVQEWTLANIEPLIASAGGDSDEPIEMVIFCYDPDSEGGDDSTLIPIHITVDDGGDPLQTTNGSDLDLVVPDPLLSSTEAAA